MVYWAWGYLGWVVISIFMLVWAGNLLVWETVGIAFLYYFDSRKGTLTFASQLVQAAQ
jgi:hypothetical protein